MSNKVLEKSSDILLSFGEKLGVIGAISPFTWFLDKSKIPIDMVVYVEYAPLIFVGLAALCIFGGLLNVYKLDKLGHYPKL